MDLVNNNSHSGGCTLRVVSRQSLRNYELDREAVNTSRFLNLLTIGTHRTIRDHSCILAPWRIRSAAQLGGRDSHGWLPSYEAHPNISLRRADL